MTVGPAVYAWGFAKDFRCGVAAETDHGSSTTEPNGSNALRRWNSLLHFDFSAWQQKILLETKAAQGSGQTAQASEHGWAQLQSKQTSPEGDLHGQHSYGCILFKLVVHSVTNDVGSTSGSRLRLQYLHRSRRGVCLGIERARSAGYRLSQSSLPFICAKVVRLCSLVCGSLQPAFQPIPVPFPQDVKVQKVACGAYHTMCIANGSVFAWGHNGMWSAYKSAHKLL